MSSHVMYDRCAGNLKLSSPIGHLIGVHLIGVIGVHLIGVIGVISMYLIGVIGVIGVVSC
jgi:hypothetical protein